LASILSFQFRRAQYFRAGAGFAWHVYQRPDQETMATTMADYMPAGTVDNLAYHAFAAKPNRTAFVFAAMGALILVLVILTVVYHTKYAECQGSAKGSFSNLLTGGNNPQWHNQMGDAGWGGTLHSTYQPGQSRVYGASAAGGHNEVAVPTGVVRGCGGGVSSIAAEDAHGLVAAQAFDASTSGSAKNMSDDALMRVMKGEV
jgi:hypothetical protein